MNAENKALILSRWVLFLPAAVICSAVAWSLAYALIRSATAPFFPPESAFVTFTVQLVANAALGGAAVLVGAGVAPSHRRQVALAICGLVFLVSCYLGYIAATSGMPWSLFGDLCMNVGSVGALIRINRR